MLFWGWLPHLYPSFGLKFEPRLFADTISKLDKVSIRANDDDPDEASPIEVGPIGEFSYGTTAFRMSITIGDVR